MKEYQQKHMMRTLVYSRVTIVFLFIICALFIRSILELNDKRIETSKLRDDSYVERKELEEKVKKAQEKNDYIDTPRGFEDYIRTTFPVVKEGGEGVIVVYDDTKSSVVSSVRENMTVWERLLVLWHRFVK